MSPVYPCHVNPRDMRTHPIGTGPFKFAEFKPNEYIRVVKNPDYWKPGRPYLDGIEWTIIPNRSTQTLAFIAGKFDMSFPYEVTLLARRHPEPGAERDLRDDARHRWQSPCSSTGTAAAVRRSRPAAGDAADDRPQELSRHHRQGQGDIDGAMQSPPGRAVGAAARTRDPAGLWARCRGQPRRGAQADARNIGYGPDHRLAVKVATRNIAQYRDPAIILIDQMKEIYIDGELDAVETANWFPKIARKDYMVGANLSGSGVDDPDAYFFEHYACGSERNYTNYCNPELEKMYEQQSIEPDRTSARSWSGRSTAG